MTVLKLKTTRWPLCSLFCNVILCKWSQSFLSFDDLWTSAPCLKSITWLASLLQWKLRHNIGTFLRHVSAVVWSAFARWISLQSAKAEQENRTRQHQECQSPGLPGWHFWISTRCDHKTTVNNRIQFWSFGRRFRLGRFVVRGDHWCNLEFGSRVRFTFGEIPSDKSV